MPNMELLWPQPRLLWSPLHICHQCQWFRSYGFRRWALALYIALLSASRMCGTQSGRIEALCRPDPTIVIFLDSSFGSSKHVKCLHVLQTSPGRWFLRPPWPDLMQVSPTFRMPPEPKRTRSTSGVRWSLSSVLEGDHRNVNSLKLVILSETFDVLPANELQPL